MSCQKFQSGYPLAVTHLGNNVIKLHNAYGLSGCPQTTSTTSAHVWFVLSTEAEANFALLMN